MVLDGLVEWDEPQDLGDMYHVFEDVQLYGRTAARFILDPQRGDEWLSDLELRNRGILRRLLSYFARGRVSFAASSEFWFTMFCRSPPRPAPAKAQSFLGPHLFPRGLSSVCFSRYLHTSTVNLRISNILPSTMRPAAGLESTRPQPPVAERSRSSLGACSVAPWRTGIFKIQR